MKIDAARQDYVSVHVACYELDGHTDMDRIDDIVTCINVRHYK